MLEVSSYNQDSFVCAVIVTYNPDLVIFLRQLNSLFTEVDFVVVVDNGSANIIVIEQEISLILAESGLKIKIIRNLQNEGLGKAQNIGIKFAKTKLATHILLLDQDSVLNIGFVEQLLCTEKELLDQGKKIAAIGPIYYNEISGEIYPITKYIGPFIERIKPDNVPVEATFLIASGSLIRLDVINEVGYMDESLFIDYIDVEWSFRAKSYGYALFASPDAKMVHTIGDRRASIFGRSISVHSPLRRYYLYRNSIYMIKNPEVAFGYKIREITFNGMRFFIFLILSNQRRKYFKYSISGFIDGFKGVKGRCSYEF